MKNRFSILRVVACFWLSIVSISTGFAHTPNQQNTIDKALLWLEQQQVNGVFETPQSSSIAWQASQEALEAFVITDELSHLNTQALATFYDNKNNLETEFLSRRILLKLRLGQSFKNDLEILKSRQNRDGGFGSEIGFGSSVYDTAFALQAVAQDMFNHRQSVFAALEYLKSQQQMDGSFLFEGNHSAVALSSLVLTSLQPYLFQFDVGVLLSTTQQYLLNQINNSQNMPVWQQSMALLAVMPLTTDVGRYSHTLNQLRAAQQENGSWFQDVFSTALAVQALQRSQNTEQATDPAHAVITGRILAQGSQQPLASVRVSFDGQNEAAVSDSDGRFTLIKTTAGDFTLHYFAEGHYSVTQTGSLLNGQRLDVGVVQLTPKPDVGIIRGYITDAASAEPLSGVQISLAGGGAIFSDANGYFRLIAAPGEVILTASHANYMSVTGSAIVQAGSELMFSPILYRIDEEQPDTHVLLRGRVIDEATSLPLAGAQISINQGTFVAFSDGDGQFSVPNVSTGLLTIQLSAQGYNSVEARTLAASGGVQDVGTLMLQANVPSNGTVLFGRVVDAGTQEGVPYAQLQVTESITVQADAQGAYRVDIADILEAGIFVQADGYQSQIYNLKLLAPRHYELNFDLAPFSVGGITITSLTPERIQYGAYQPVKFHASLINNGGAARRVQAQLTIRDANDNIVRQMTVGVDKDISGAALPVTLVPDIPVDMVGEWFSGAFPEGEYRLVLAVFDVMNQQVLAEKSGYIRIETDQTLDSIELLASPQISKVGAEEELRLAVRVGYRGNAAANYQLEYQLINPDDEVVLQGNEPLLLQPKDFSTLIQLPSEVFTFEQSGRFLLQANIAGQALSIAPVWITVAPATRIEVSQGLTPDEVMPDASRILHVEIQLQGVKQP